MIFRLLCLLSTALLMLMIWPFGSSLLQSLLWWRAHKELCFDWSIGLSTGIFLSIRANVRPLSSQWIPTKPTSSPTSSYSTSASLSIPLPSLKAKFFPGLKALRCISASSRCPSKEFLSLLYKAFLRPLLTYASPGWFPFLSITNFTKLERLHRVASRAITGCLLSSPIPLALSEASLPPL